MTSNDCDRHELLPPSVEIPYWRWRDGRRAAFQEAAVAVSDGRVAELDEVHAGRIAELTLAGLRALRAGDDAEARRLLAAASRLCAEPTGQFPASGVAIDS